MSRLTQQLTQSVTIKELDDFISEKYSFIDYINDNFNLTLEKFPSLQMYLNKPVINLLSLEKDFSQLEKDFYDILLNACLNNHDQAINVLAKVYNTAEGRSLASKVYQDFFTTDDYIDFILGGNNIKEEFNIQIYLTPKKALSLIRLLVASANK